MRRFIFGRPTATEEHEHTRLPKILALPVFASDAISSSVYATQEILLALSVAGVAALRFTLHISLAISILLIIVVASYWQTIHAYPGGGGSYIVSKENLGIRFGLIAAAALLIDYIMTVATSIAAGVQNLVAMPFMHAFTGHVILLCIIAVLMLVWANVRGLKESGTLFALPTYVFVLSAFALLFFGILGPSILGWHLNPTPASPAPLHAAEGLGILLYMKAFARGCAAITGTEAISNGVPAFRRNESRNAALTLAWMGIILGILFVGISYLAVDHHVVYVSGSQPVIDQLNSIVFGKGSWFYYVLQLATVAILVLAANTSFADFPRLSAILARDGFMPRQLSHLGDKLTFTNGIVMLGIFCVVLLAIFEGNTDRLIPLYAIGVFVAFTLSQTGMVVHWFKERGSGWWFKAIFNGIGALATFLVMLNIAYEKVLLDVYNLVTRHETEFGWIIVLLIALQYGIFRAIERHYRNLRRALSMEDYARPAEPFANTVLVMIPRLHRGIMMALNYAGSLSADVRAVHIETDESQTPLLKAEWEKWGGDIPLVIMESRYRSIIGPLLAYLNEVERERPNTNITVVVPEYVTSKWWHALLHANYGAWIKLYLLKRKNVFVTNVRYFVEKSPSAPSNRVPGPVGSRK